MQQVLNSKERNEAFLKFLVFFLVTVALVVLAVFFDYRLPISENKALQEEVSIHHQQEVSEAKFVAKMNEALQLQDSIEKGGVNVDQIDISLGAKLQEMEILRQKDDPSSYGRMNNIIMDKLFQLQQARQSVRNLKKSSDQVEKLKSDLNSATTQLAEANNELDAIRKNGGR
jgi:hypothetical protein